MTHGMPSLAELFVPTYVYRLFAADGVVLYIGCTRTLDRRLAHHRTVRADAWHQVADMSVEVYQDRYVAENAERDAILLEQPLWNKLKARPVSLSGPTLQRSRSESADHSREDVLAALASLGRPAQVRTVAACLGKSRPLVRARLGELVDRGRVEKIGDSQRPKYRICPAVDQTA